MHDSFDPEAEDGVNKPLATLGAAAAGALAMYYLDPELGERRRALLAELVRGGLPGERRGGARGRLARRHVPRHPATDPRSDAELRDRVRAALDRMVSHPRALHVAVEDGVVRLSGAVLALECEGVLAQVRRMAGVRKVVNAMNALGNPRDLVRRDAPVPLHATSR